jgi:hypothetical protein
MKRHADARRPLLIANRGRLLILAGHNETLNHLIDDVNRFGHTTSEIRGSICPHELRW